MLNKQMKFPNHIAIILDGNRRWAKKKGLKPWMGHRYGAKKVEEILKTALNLNIHCISFWGSSLDNLVKRSKRETLFLLEIFRREFLKLAENKDIHKNKVRIEVIGRWREMFPEKVKKSIQLAIDNTKHYNNMLLNFFLAYSGTDEMMQAICNITNLAKNKKNLQITPELIKHNLFTSNLPPVDFLIRTGGEPHLSCGFMMWDIADAQLYFLDKLWPDFTREDFIKAIEEYQRRQRRFGK